MAARAAIRRLLGNVLASAEGLLGRDTSGMIAAASSEAKDKWAVFAEPPRAKKDKDVGRVRSIEPHKIHVVELLDTKQKVKGLGTLQPSIASVAVGDIYTLPHSQKSITRVPPRLPELHRGIVRYAQDIKLKDAAYLVGRLGLGAGDRVLEAGLGSGGCALYVARSLGSSGLHVTVEPKETHAQVGLLNLRRAQECWAPHVPQHHHVEGALEDVVPTVSAHAHEFDAIILDLPNHPSAVQAAAPLLALGGRLACYCPVTSQLEKAWAACEAAGLHVEWAGELIEREWGVAKLGGARPVNGPIGHTAFMVIAQRRVEMEPAPRVARRPRGPGGKREANDDDADGLGEAEHMAEQQQQRRQHAETAIT